MESQKLQTKSAKLDLAPSSKCKIQKAGGEKKTLNGIIDLVETASTELHEIKKKTVWERRITGKVDQLNLKRYRMRLEYEKRPDPCPARKRLVILFLVVLLMVETFAYVHLTIKQSQSFQNEATNLNEVHTDGNAVHDTLKDENQIG